MVLPVHLQADHIGAVVDDLAAGTAGLPFPVELVLVPNGPDRDGTHGTCRGLARDRPGVRCVPAPGPGWGLAVRVGLEAAQGDLLAFANSARIRAGALREVLAGAAGRRDTMVKGLRVERESVLRGLVSRLYNLECRLLFGLPLGDVNGFPKAFHRVHLPGLLPARGDYLFDLELCLAWQARGLAFLELPITAPGRNGGASLTGPGTALALFLGALRLRLRSGRQPPAP